MRCTGRTLPRAAVYAGSGASHSWTWFADLFERFPAAHAVFVTEHDVAAGALEDCDLLFVSGGDTFAVAEGLGATGAARIEHFVRTGGLYVGACAGAYLPLRSSLAPLHLFNFVEARIGNLATQAPAALRKPEKCCTAYGCRYVVHPVRGSVRLRLHEGCAGNAQGWITAPLYGGPALLPSDEVEVLAVYDGFSDETEFLTDPATARDIMIGTAAAVKKKFGDGCFYLFGPHCEHPSFPEANHLLLDIVSTAGAVRRAAQDMPQQVVHDDADPEDARTEFRAFVSSLSNARIMALGLERAAYRWRIGMKVYDPEKILVMIAAMFSRARRLDASGCSRHIAPSHSAGWRDRVETVCACLRRFREDSEDGTADRTAGELFTALRTTAADFLTVYFDFRRNNFSPDEGRLSCTTTTCTSRPPRRSIPCRL